MLILPTARLGTCFSQAGQAPGPPLLWQLVNQYYGDSFPNQQNFSNAATQQMTQAEVMQAAAKVAYIATMGRVSVDECALARSLCIKLRKTVSLSQ